MTSRNIDSKLWDEVKKYCKGDTSEKLHAVDIIFKQHYQLPEECIEFARALAKPDQAKEIRIAITKYVVDAQEIPFGMYSSLLEILSKDSDQDIQKILATNKLYQTIQKFATGIEQMADNLKTLESVNFAVSPMLKNLEAFYQNPIFKSLESVNFAVSPMLKNLEVINVALNIPALKNLATIELQNIIPTKELTSITGISESINREFSKDLLRHAMSYYNSEELEEINKPVQKLQKKKTIELIEKLKNCKKGIKYWKEYEKICEEIFSYCFMPPLEEPLSQEFTEDTVYRRDLIFYIPYGVGGFCQFLSQFGMGIVIDCKNYTDLIGSNEVRIATKYLGKKKLTTFGLIVTRKGLNDGGKKAQRDLWIESDQLVICLNDDDLIKMLELKEKNDEPWKVIDLLIKKFRSAT